MNQFKSFTEKNSFVIDSLVDLLLTQKITNIKVLKLESDQFHDNVIICTANSSVQMSAIIKNIRKIDKLNFIGLQNCGHLPHVDLPSLSSKIIQDYFLE